MDTGSWQAPQVHPWHCLTEITHIIWYTLLESDTINCLRTTFKDKLTLYSATQKYSSVAITLKPYHIPSS